MERLTKLLRKATLPLFLLLCLGGLTACRTAQPVVIPDDRVLVPLVNGTGPMPGWYGISGGYLREIFRKCGEME